MSSYFIAHGIKRKHGIIIIWDLSVTGIWLQFRSVVVLMIRRLGYCKMLFITLLFGYSILAIRWDSWIDFIGQRTRWHSYGMIKNNVCLNISVESCCPKIQACHLNWLLVKSICVLFTDLLVAKTHWRALSSKTDTYKYKLQPYIHRSTGIVLLPFNTKASQPIHLALRFRHRCVHVTSITVIQATELWNIRTTFFRRPCSLLQQKKKRITLGTSKFSFDSCFLGGWGNDKSFDCLFILFRYPTPQWFLSWILINPNLSTSKPRTADLLPLFLSSCVSRDSVS